MDNSKFSITSEDGAFKIQYNSGGVTVTVYADKLYSKKK